ncbi:MAG: type II secretion system protein GspG [bacterium]
MISTLKIMAHCVQQYYNIDKKYPTKLSRNDFAQYGLKNNDPWNNMYIYETNGKSFTFLSIGPDGIKGNKDDIGIYQEKIDIFIKGIDEWGNEIRIDFSKRLMKTLQIYGILLVTLFVFTIWSGWSFISTFNLRLRWQILMIIGIIIIFSLPNVFLPRW